MSTDQHKQKRRKVVEVEEIMAEVAALPEEFRSLEEDFVDSKMAINNAINDLVHSQGAVRSCAASARFGAL